MIEPKLDDEIKFEIHGYFYAKTESHQYIADVITFVFKKLAEEGILHNAICRTTQVNWEDPVMPIPIFENEADLPDEVDDDMRRRRLYLLEHIAIAQKLGRM
jgi:hypothetical protein